MKEDSCNTDSLYNLSLLDPPKWGWCAAGGIVDVCAPHEKARRKSSRVDFLIRQKAEKRKKQQLIQQQLIQQQLIQQQLNWEKETNEQNLKKQKLVAGTAAETAIETATDVKMIDTSQETAANDKVDQAMGEIHQDSSATATAAPKEANEIEVVATSTSTSTSTCKTSLTLIQDGASIATSSTCQNQQQQQQLELQQKNHPEKLTNMKTTAATAKSQNNINITMLNKDTVTALSTTTITTRNQGQKVPSTGQNNRQKKTEV